MQRWKFVPTLVAAVTYHHRPQAAAPHEKLAALIYCADMVSHFLGHSAGAQPFSMNGREEAASVLSLKADDITRYMAETLKQFDLVDALCELRQ